jgi:hypothetical protein
VRAADRGSPTPRLAAWSPRPSRPR